MQVRTRNWKDEGCGQPKTGHRRLNSEVPNRSRSRASRHTTHETHETHDTHDTQYENKTKITILMKMKMKMKWKGIIASHLEFQSFSTLHHPRRECYFLVRLDLLPCRLQMPSHETWKPRKPSIVLHLHLLSRSKFQNKRLDILNLLFSKNLTWEEKARHLRSCNDKVLAIIIT